MNTSYPKRSGANALLNRRPLTLALMQAVSTVATRNRAMPLSSAIATALVLAGAVGTAHAQDSGASCNMIGPACDLSTPVVNGNDGPGADYHDNGHPGTAGNPGGDITADLEDARTLHNTGTVSPINVVTIGGKGGNGSFTVHTNVPSTHGRVGLGMNMYNWKNVDLSVNYSTEFGGGYHANAGIARLAWHF